MRVEVEESELLNPPVAGAMFWVSGEVRRSNRNGTISLMATSHKFVAATMDGLSVEQMEQYVRGMLARGVGVVQDKQSISIGRGPAWNSVVLKWQGATHDFKKLTPELYLRIPGKGSYVRFEFSAAVRSERREGQLVNLQIPDLLSVTLDKLETGSVAPPPPAGKTAATLPGAKV